MRCHEPKCSHCGDTVWDCHPADGCCEDCWREIHEGKVPPADRGLAHFTGGMSGPGPESDGSSDSPWGENCTRILEGDA